MAYIKKIHIDNARIIFRNFSGKTSQFNRNGNRSFSVVLTPEQAKQYEQDGWHVKYLRPREPGDEPTPILNVNVRYHSANPERNPRLYMVSGRKKTLLNENTVGSLDYAELTNVDLLISPYHYNVIATGESGVSAYLQEGYFTLEDYFGGKYDFDEEDANEPW